MFYVLKIDRNVNKLVLTLVTVFKLSNSINSQQQTQTKFWIIKINSRELTPVGMKSWLIENFNNTWRLNIEFGAPWAHTHTHAQPRRGEFMNEILTHMVSPDMKKPSHFYAPKTESGGGQTEQYWHYGF